MGEQWSNITVRDPLPLSLAGALMKLIGTAWPDARIRTEPGVTLAMSVPNTRAKTVSKRAAKQILDEEAAVSEGIEDAQLTRLTPGEFAMQTPEELQMLMSGVVHQLMESFEDAANYLTWDFTAGDKGYEVTIRRSAGESPAQKIARALAALEAGDPDKARSILANKEVAS